MSLVEVLVAIGVLSLGLLGVAALFPVAGFYMQTGDVADRADAVAQAVLADAMNKGYLNPANWRMLDNSTGWFSLSYPTALGNGTPTVTGLKRLAGTPNAVQYRGNWRMLGGMVAIDPFAIGQATEENLSTATAIQPALDFPMFNPNGYTCYPNSAPGWFPWFGAGGATPIRRLTLPFRDRLDLINRSAWLAIADDDTSIDVPTRADQPGQQLMRKRALTPNPAPTDPVAPVYRQSRGAFSWLFTIAPTSAEARNALATSPNDFEYDVSAVVFHRRGAAALPDLTTPPQDMISSYDGDYSVAAKVVSRNPNGGELLLEHRFAPGLDFKHLRPGGWVMLYGPHPLSDNPSATAPAARPMLFAQWYRVLSVDASIPGDLQEAGFSQRLVSLRGPDWPWNPAPTAQIRNIQLLSNDLRVAIIPDVAAVHTKTLRLDSRGAWNWE